MIKTVFLCVLAAGLTGYGLQMPLPEPKNVPDLLTTSAGEKVATVDQWEKVRAPELLALFEREEYGRRPAAANERDRVSFDVYDVSEALGGKAVRKLVRVTYKGPNGIFSFPFTAYIPKTEKPVPAFVLAANIKRGTLDEKQGLSSVFWPVEEIVARGYATAAFRFDVVAADKKGAGFSQGVFPAVQPESARDDESWGTLSAWAWGNSRILDWMETEPLIDAKHVGVVGHSRGGKTAILTAVLDRRFAMACSNNSGCSGAKLNHIDLPKSESIKLILKNFPYWFCRNYRKHAGKEMTMDFDQHELLALIAPRLLCVASATDDYWAGPRGEWWAAKLASPVWELYGKKGLVADAYPAPEKPQQEGCVSYHLRKGPHFLAPYDWHRYMDFADRHGWRGCRRTLWQIGVKDGTGNEFALAPRGYNDFLQHDFGWENNYFLVGRSDAKKSFPYVLPGVNDKWAGSGKYSGRRTQQVNILFDIAKKGAGGAWTLVIDFADVHKMEQPLLKVSVNGKPRKMVLPVGGGDESIMKGDFSKAKPFAAKFDLADGEIVEGANEIKITSIEGSWAIFDDVRLEGPGDAVVRLAHKGAYVRSVKAGGYLIPGTGKQPLLVDVEHLDGAPVVRVEIDGKVVLEQRVEAGMYSLEAPMDAAAQGKYRVFVDGECVREGTVVRTPQRDAGVAGYVDTRMGTAHSRWMLVPGPWMPFSMVKLSPDNEGTPGRGQWQGGYDPTIESVGCFSHIHEWTMAGLGTMPTTGPLKIKMGDSSEIKGHADGYRSAVDKSSEVCKAGYYAVKLTDYDIFAELTATDRCGFQRYTYPAGKTPRVMIDLLTPTEYTYNILDCEMRQTGPRRIEGFSKQETPRVCSRDADQFYTVHFVIEFDRDIAKFGGWEGDALWTGSAHAAQNPKSFGCYVEFKPADGATVVQMRSGISFVDIAGAANNLKREIEEPFGWSFEKVRAANEATWNDLLGRVKIATVDRLEKKRFYTNLYRSFCRNTFNDVDGRWSDPFGKIQKLGDPDARAMGCDAFWNTFWNLNQAWNLVGPEWSARWVKSQMALFEAGGWLGKGPAGMRYIPVMVAEHAIPLMVSAWQMGIRVYDPKKLLAAFVKMQTTPGQKVGRGYAGNRNLAAYMQYHYVPSDKGTFSNSMEYSFDDWTVGQFAKAIGDEAAYKTFSERGTWWKNAVNPESGYCHRRDSKGEWDKTLTSISGGISGKGYVEGNAWQLTFFVPQDVPALVEIVGRERFLERLKWGFEKSRPFRYNAPGENYAKYPVVQGNQQSMHFAFLFNWAGEPWETQKWARSIMERYYGFGDSTAWLGDEDQGQMSAWFVMASLGLFQTDGGCRAEPVYEIASPLFEEATIDLGGRFGRGDKFTIKAHNASRANKYVQRAVLNGKPQNSFLVDAREVLKGGTLELWMGPEPSREWGL